MSPSFALTDVRPTRRGLVALVTVVAAVLSAAFFGARGLNAVAAPGVVALAFAVVEVARLEAPEVRRELPDRGEQGSSVSVTLDVRASRPFSARLEEAVGSGVVAAGEEATVTLGDVPVEYDLALMRRGDWTVGPATIEARDVLGLVSRRFEDDATSQIRVRPPLYPLGGPRADELVWIFGGGEDRQEFDFLRHYRRGDPLRDIHWRSSAKVPEGDFVVKEFRTGQGVSTAVIAAESPAGRADKMAAAVASIAGHLLAEGLRVGVVTADVDLKPRAGGDHLERILDALALTDGGPLGEGDRSRANLVVQGGIDGVMVELDSTAVTFALVAGHPLPPPPFETGTSRSPGWEAA